MPGNQDFIDAVYGNFPLLIVLISVVTYILLARAFRSLLHAAQGGRAEHHQRRGRVGP